jgi:hypothetical protein
MTILEQILFIFITICIQYNKLVSYCIEYILLNFCTVTRTKLHNENNVTENVRITIHELIFFKDTSSPLPSRFIWYISYDRKRRYYFRY